MPPLSTDYVFMSYSRRDDAVMRRIVAFLREQGIKVWVDNEKLIPGTPVWEKEIEKAVQGASAVVVALSPDSKDSEWVRREISIADQYEKRVFPLLVRGDEKTSISIRLIGRQYVDIRSNEDAGLNYVSATLLRYLEELNEREQSAKKEADRLAAQKIKTEKRLASRKAEEERIALEKIEAERKAKEDADRLSAQKAKEERIALEKITTDRKAKEDADRLAAQKAELDSKEKLARENAEREAAAKVAGEKLEKPAVKSLPVVENKNVSKNNLRLFGIGGVILFILICGGFGLNYLIKNLPVATATLPSTNDTPAPLPTETLVPTPALGIGSTEISPKDGMTLLYVPAGEFLMGSTDADTLVLDDEKPQYPVMLDAYWIDKTEVTNAQYVKCVADNGACKEPTNKSSYTYSSYYGNSEFDHYPVLYVDWNMANSYCYWAGRELPTEAQWEKAARGENGNIYPWGNEWDVLSTKRLNFSDKNDLSGASDTVADDGYGDVSPVGNYSSGQSVYGAYDMAGNVWEWVNDWYDVYPGGDPVASPDFGQKYRVLRGGSWSSYNSSVRSANRGNGSPTDSNIYFGFRCARSQP